MLNGMRSFSITLDEGVGLASTSSWLMAHSNILSILPRSFRPVSFLAFQSGLKASMISFCLISLIGREPKLEIHNLAVAASPVVCMALLTVHPSGDFHTSWLQPSQKRLFFCLKRFSPPSPKLQTLLDQALKA